MRPTLTAGLLAVVFAIPATAAPDKTKPAPPGDAADIADKLLERMDLERFEQVSVRTIIDVLQEKLGYTILVDHAAILGSRGDGGGPRAALDEQQIALPAMKRVRIETALRQVLDQMTADYYIEADHVQVTSPAMKALVMGPRRVLPELRRLGDDEAQEIQAEITNQIRFSPTLTLAFKEVPLADALKTISERTGRTATINPDAVDKAKTTVSVTLTNAPFETAVSVLAEATGLRAYRTGNAAVFVTPERAKRIDDLAARLSGGPFVDSRMATPDAADLRADADRQALEEKVRTLTAELEKFKKK
jgi:hypothetical protein